MHHENAPDQRSATEQIARALAETTALSGGDAALIAKAAEALAATTTEWGVRVGDGSVRPMRDETHARNEAATLNELFESRDWQVVSREVTEWREVTP